MPQIPQFTDDLGFISRLGDNPNTDDGLSSQALKEEFDKAPKIIQQFINSYVIPALNNYITGNGYLQIAGGYMTGPIVMQGNKVTMLGEPEADDDAATKGYVAKMIPSIVPVTGGGTGETNAEDALTALGGAKAKHSHAASDINTGTLATARLPTVPINKGGTGASNGATGLKNLLAAGYMQMSSYQIVSSVSAIPSNAPNGSLFLVPVEE